MYPTALGAAVAALVLLSMTGGPSIAESAPNRAPTFPTQITNVVVIVFENAEASTVLAQGPYFGYLAQHYAYAADDYAICHPSAPNYLALTSGATYSQCGSDAHHVYRASNLANLAARAHRSWAAYAESMPTACDLTNTYPYAVKHEPFLFYGNVLANTSRCTAHVLNFTALQNAVNASRLPNLAFVTPNLRDDGHDTNVSFASAWLHGFLTPLVNRSSFAHTAYFIVFDEGTSNLGAGNSSAGPTNTTGGGHVYLSIVSPLSVGIGNVTNLSSHYTVLTTIEWLLGLPSSGHNDRASLWPPLRAAFG